MKSKNCETIFSFAQNNRIVKVIIVGGGAAGVFCAIQLRERILCEVIILEKTNELLKKVKISGGGRCNVTHNYISQAQFSKNYPRGAKVLKQNLTYFSPQDMQNWLRERKVALKTEGDGRVFPKTDDSQTIIDCFLTEIQRHHIHIQFQTEVQSISTMGTTFNLHTNQGNMEADILVIATGGAQKARELDILKPFEVFTVPPVPSLFTFKINEPKLTELMGLSIPNASVRITGTEFKEIGPVLITHWGLSGPGILKLSAWGAFALSQLNYHFQIAINWLGEISENELRTMLEDNITLHGQAKLVNRRIEGLPQRFWEYLITKAEIQPERKWAELSKKNINKLVDCIGHSVYDVRGKTTFKEEFVTAGGVDIESLNTKTMESKTTPNLYFIGEVTNIDGITGGFNFQNAWTSAVICAEGIAKKWREKNLNE